MSAAAASVGMQLVGGAMQAVGQVKQIEGLAQSHDYNARVAKFNAAQSRQQAAEDARLVEIHGRKSIGSIRANIGASGITNEASAMDVLEMSAANAEKDRLTVIHAGELKAKGYEMQEEYSTNAASGARSQKFFAAAASILGAGSGAAGTAAQLGVGAKASTTTAG